MNISSYHHLPSSLPYLELKTCNASALATQDFESPTAR